LTKQFAFPIIKILSCYSPPSVSRNAVNYLNALLSEKQPFHLILKNMFNTEVPITKRENLAISVCLNIF